MEATWIFILFTLTLTLKFLLLKLNQNRLTLPPGPSSILFFVKNVVINKKSLLELEQIIRELHKKYGPMLHLSTINHSTVFIQDREISHQALVQNGSAFSDRPRVKEPMLYLSCNGHDINSSYGSLWRLLRRNLTSEMLHPARIRLFGPARQWALQILLNKLRTQAERGNKNGVLVIETFQFAMLCLSVAMCFGEKPDEKLVKEIQDVQYSLLLIFTRFNVFAIFPKIMKVLFRRKWKNIVGFRRRQAEIFISLIRARKEEMLGKSKGEFQYPYIESLLDLKIPEEGGRKLGEGEIVNLCHEFLSGTSDTTSTTLEWIMAELVNHQEIQKGLVEEIKGVVQEDEEIKDEDLQKMPYLKAVIMEGLRRHPPGHFLLPHRVAEDVKLNGYLIPKGAEVHFNVMQLGLEENVWKDPMEFRPERFLDQEVVDITGSREIKMMPFGAGRRMCPGYMLAILHLEYFVANLVREFEWKAVDGIEVDLSEKFEFTTVMKNPLHAQIIPRRNK